MKIKYNIVKWERILRAENVPFYRIRMTERDYGYKRYCASVEKIDIGYTIRVIENEYENALEAMVKAQSFYDTLSSKNETKLK